MATMFLWGPFSVHVASFLIAAMVKFSSELVKFGTKLHGLCEGIIPLVSMHSCLQLVSEIETYHEINFVKKQPIYIWAKMHAKNKGLTLS